jgi:hypothetical protein
MQSPENKVDMAEMNTAIDKVLALPAAPKAKQKEGRAQRNAGHPPPAKSSKSAAQPALR